MNLLSSGLLWVALCAPGSALAAPDVSEIRELALTHMGEGRYQEAVTSFSEVLELQRRAFGPTHPDVADAHNRLGLALKEVARLDEAATHYQRALEIYTAELGPESRPVATVLGNQGVLQRARGDLKGALELQRHAAAIAEAAMGPDHLEVADKLANLGVVLMDLGKYREAEEACDRALAVRETQLGPDDPMVAFLLDALALIYQRTARYEPALATYERALQIREEVLGPDHPETGGALNNYASFLFMEGDPRRALPLFERSLQIARDNLGPKHPNSVSGLTNLGAVHETLGDYEVARKLYEESLAISLETRGPNHPAVGVVVNQLGRLASRLGDHLAALAHFERALAILEATLGPEHRNVGIVVMATASTLTVLERHEDADRLYERALAIQRAAMGPDHPEVARWLTQIGGVSANRGELERAETLVRQALEITDAQLEADHPAAVDALGALAHVHHKRGRLADAKGAYQEVIDARIRTFGSGSTRTLSALAALADVEHALGDREAERETAARLAKLVNLRLEALLDSQSEREQLALIGIISSATDKYLRAFDRPTDAADALTQVLRHKGAVTRSATARRAAVLASDDLEVSAQLRKLNQTRKAIAKLVLGADADGGDRVVQIAALTDEKEALERALAGLVVREAHIEVADVCRAVPDDATAVEVVRTGDRYLAFVLDGDCSPVRVDLGEREAIDEAIEEYRSLLDSGVMTTRIDRVGGLVRERVWAPIEPHIDSPTVLFAPTGSLSSVSLAGLPTGDGRYLVETHLLTYLASTADLVAWRDRPRRDYSTALLVGDIDYGAVDDGDDTRGAAAPCIERRYAPLPGSAVEVRDLSRQLSKRRVDTTVITGDLATEDHLWPEVAGKRIVHLATHGFFASGQCRSAMGAVHESANTTRDIVAYNPMILSGIVLAGANRPIDPYSDSDGIWTAEEATGLDLAEAELVVLSACETGLGVVTGGEGVLGLRRSIAIAGARHMVMSLWSVPDAETSQLMSNMYTALLRKRRSPSPAMALREAQLEALEHFRGELGEARPYAWAGFIAAGVP